MMTRLLLNYNLSVANPFCSGQEAYQMFPQLPLRKYILNVPTYKTNLSAEAIMPYMQSLAEDKISYDSVKNSSLNATNYQYEQEKFDFRNDLFVRFWWTGCNCWLCDTLSSWLI